jgi:hypothetical protein
MCRLQMCKYADDKLWMCEYADFKCAYDKLHICTFEIRTFCTSTI